MQIDLNSGILIIGLVQGLFLAISIGLHKQGPIIANRFLVILLLCFVNGLAVHFLTITQLWQDYITYYIIASSVVFLFGPSVYLYAKKLTRPNDKLSYWHIAHLIPIILYLILITPLLNQSKIQIIDSLTASHDQQNIGMMLPLFKAISILVYLLLTLKLVFSHHHRIKQVFSQLDKVSLNWLRNLLIGFLSFELIFVGSMIFDFDHSLFAGQLDSLFSFILVLMIFMTGFHGMQQPEIFRGLSELNQDDSVNKTQLEDAALPIALIETKSKYQSSNINDEDIVLIKNTLHRLFEVEHIYLERFLDLRQLAARSKVTSHQLSQYLNEHLGQSFYDFVNQYRISAAKKALCQSDSSILDIALNVGFNNKATFNKAFKKYTKLTPSEFRSKNQLVNKTQ